MSNPGQDPLRRGQVMCAKELLEETTYLGKDTIAVA